MLFTSFPLPPSPLPIDSHNSLRIIKQYYVWNACLKCLFEMLAYGIQNPWALESLTDLKESGILLTIGTWNTSSIDKESETHLGQHMNNFSRCFRILPLLDISERWPSESDDGSAESNDNDSTSPRQLLSLSSRTSGWGLSSSLASPLQIGNIIYDTKWASELSFSWLGLRFHCVDSTH